MHSAVKWLLPDHSCLSPSSSWGKKKIRTQDFLLFFFITHVTLVCSSFTVGSNSLEKKKKVDTTLHSTIKTTAIYLGVLQSTELNLWVDSYILKKIFLSKLQDPLAVTKK